MKWSDVLPEHFEWGVDSTSACCWVKPNAQGEDEPEVGELERHVYPDADGEHGVIIATMTDGIDVKLDSVKRRYCMIPPPPEQGWSGTPPKSVGWYWVRTADGGIDAVLVYVDDDERMVFAGIDWPPFRVTAADTPNLSWSEIPVPE